MNYNKRTGMSVEDLWDDGDVDLTGYYNDAAEQQARMDMAEEVNEQEEQEEEKPVVASRRSMHFTNTENNASSKWDKFKV